MSFDPVSFLDSLRRERGYAGQLGHVQVIPLRDARYGALRARLSPPVQRALAAAGAERLYTHQAEAINAALAGQHVVVATSTASGKTLCFNVPVLEALARDPLARALYLYPTKALAQDQLGKWNAFVKGAREGIIAPLAATYDGDTPQSARARIRKQARVLLTNPDMLHTGILPNHPLWAEFFRHLTYVVIDEAHTYRGVFGSQVACVLRRLRRVCALYQGAGVSSQESEVRGQEAGVRGQGSEVGRRIQDSTFHIRHSTFHIEHRTSSIVHRPPPVFIATSATIANPAEHFELLTGLPARVVTDDGSPHGARYFALWNPPFLDRAKSARRSANHEASELFVKLVLHGVRTIAFTRARVVAELVLRYAREQLLRVRPELAERIAAYRAGYLPEERRRIERELFQGRLAGVVATTALELGIDVGGLDAALLVGYPGTIASLWQQAGRAGRGTEPSLAVLVALDNPLDQYYMRHPDELLGRPHEHALLDPDNIYILQRHLPCAAHEIPLRVSDEQDRQGLDDEALFGPGFVDAMVALENEGVLRFTGDRWVYTQGDYPAQGVSLRDAEGERFAVLDASNQFKLIEELSATTAPQRVHPGAIYLHQGESYLVTEYNAELRHAIVQPVNANYFTQPREINDVRIVRSVRHRELPTTVAYFGRVRVRSQVIGYRRLAQASEALLDEVPLDMPMVEYETMALWWDLPAGLPAELARRGLDFLGGIHAVEHAAIGILPLFAMCDRWDIGGLSTPRHPDTDAAQIFIYDGFPGGVGIAEKGFELLPELWSATLDVIRGCPCADGCPSCVQSPKCGNFNQPLDKAAAVNILQVLLAGEEQGEDTVRQLILASAIAFGVVASLIGAGVGLGLLLLIVLGGAPAGAMTDAAPQVLIASLALGVMTVSVGLGLALAWSAWRSLARTPARPWQWPAWGWWLLAFVAVVGTGQAVFQAGLYALMPVAHLAANALAALGVLALALGGVRRHIRPPSTRAAAGSLAWGGLAAVGLALVIEVLLAVVGVVIFSAWLTVTQPELVASLQAWAERLQGGPPPGLQPLAPPPDVVAQLFRSSWVVLAVLGFAGVLVPLIEEVVKGLAVPLIALTGWRLRLADGFLLGAAAGAGLALVEGVGNGALGLMAPESWAGAMFLRGAASAMHCAASGLVGLGWALAIGRRWLPALCAGALGFMLHAAWNAATVGTAALTLGDALEGPLSAASGNSVALLFVGTLVLLWLLAILILAWLPAWLARMEDAAR